MSRGDGVAVEVRWAVNPFRGDKFEELWTPAAEAALDFGATYWALYRSQEGQLDFVQHAHFPTKDHWDRYWYSEEIAEARVGITHLYQVPLLPVYYSIAGQGTRAPAAVEQ